MVNERLVARIKELLGPHPNKILVTGATGFVGSHVAATLALAGQQVTGTGRNPYLAPRQIQFQKADIRDREAVIQLCRDQDFVIHSAVKASPWESAAALYDVNVQGTQNVIDGCLQHEIKRLVHLSSTSIHFDFRDSFDVQDDAPLPPTPCCGYAETKRAAEQLVKKAEEDGLGCFIVRARAVFGPRDNSLLPRLLRAYDRGQLRQIGAGNNISELTYIDNLVWGIALALVRGPSGGVCTITGGSPIALWPMLKKILSISGREKPLRRVPYPLAYRFAHMLEWIHWLRQSSEEPTLTRYTVGLLAKSQTFSGSAAKRHLGYEPVVSMEQGVHQTTEALAQRSSEPAAECIGFSLHSTGYISERFNRVERGASKQVRQIHATFAVLDHPDFGITLFDTGYSPRFYQATARWPYRAYAKVTPVETSAALSAKSILEKQGIDPQQVKRIVISHFHADHLCGLLDFPEAEVIASRCAYQTVCGRKGLAALRRAFLPQLLPDDLEQRLCLLEHFHDPGIGPFDNCFDLFQDGTVRLIPLPGHTRGQIGALLQTDPDQRKLLVADAVWTSRTITNDLDFTSIFRLLAEDFSAAKQTRQKLVRFHQQFPEVELIPTHCPDVIQQEFCN